MAKQKRFKVNRKDGTSYFVDENDQVIHQPWDSEYFTAGTRMEESAPKTRKIGKAPTKTSVDLDKIKEQMKENYMQLGLSEAEAKLAADLDLGSKIY